MRTTFGSDFNFSDIQHMISGITTDHANDVKKLLGLGIRDTIVDRERSNTDFAGLNRQSMHGGRSTFSGNKSTWTKKSSNSQATKKPERTALLDLAVFRFEVDPETIPVNQRDPGGVTDQAASINREMDTSFSEFGFTQQTQGG